MDPGQLNNIEGDIDYRMSELIKLQDLPTRPTTCNPFLLNPGHKKMMIA